MWPDRARFRISVCLFLANLRAPDHLPPRPEFADRPIKPPSAIFKDKLVNRPNSVPRADPDIRPFAPGLEVLVDEAWNSDESALRGGDWRMKSTETGRKSLARRLEQPAALIRPRRIDQLELIGDRE